MREDIQKRPQRDDEQQGKPFKKHSRSTRLVYLANDYILKNFGAATPQVLSTAFTAQNTGFTVNQSQ